MPLSLIDENVHCCIVQIPETWSAWLCETNTFWYLFDESSFIPISKYKLLLGMIILVWHPATGIKSLRQGVILFAFMYIALICYWLGSCECADSSCIPSHCGSVPSNWFEVIIIISKNSSLACSLPPFTDVNNRLTTIFHIHLRYV